MQWAKQSPSFVVSLSFALAIVILIFDLSLPLGVAAGAPYIVLVLLGYFAPWYYIYLMAVFATILTIIGYFASPEGCIPWIVLTNRGLTLFAIWMTAIIGAYIQNSEKKFRTEQGKAQAQLTILSRAIEQSPVSVIITDTQGNIEYVNPKFTKVSGYSFKEIIGQNTRILKSGETPSEEYKALWETLTFGCEWHGVFHNVKKNGELYWESASISPVLNVDGDITHYIAVKEDITEQLETEKQLSHALKLEAIGQLTSGIAHDFNNLLTIITGNLQLLMEDESNIDEKETNEILNDVYSAAKDGEELIQRLLLLLRKTKPQARNIQVNEVIMELRRVLDRMLGEDIEVTINLSEDVKTIFTDSNQLESAILNLAVNARDAMPKGGEFNIETGLRKVDLNSIDKLPNLTTGNYIVITASDTGTGMDEEVAARASEPFYTTKVAGKGSGLGLSMVYNFTKQSGGDLLIESTLGVGTAITLFLAESTHVIEEDKIQKLPESIPRGTETILVVEDNKNVRRFAVRSLQNLGYRVVETDNADTAMEVISDQGHSMDLLFSDIVIPGDKNGHELALWSREQLPELKVALTTGLRTELFDEQTIHDDELPLLRKPYSLERLALFIRKQLDTHQIQN